MKKIILLVFLTTLAGCASNSDFSLLRQDVNSLERASQDSRKQIESLKESNARALRQIENLNEKTAGVVKEESFSAVRENQADINSRLSELSNSVQDLRGRFEENKYNLEKTLGDSGTERELLKAQISALEAQVKALRDKAALAEGAPHPKELAGGNQDQGTDSLSADQEQVKPDIAAGETGSDQKGTEKKAYDSALQAFKNRKFREAREKFGIFIKEYPTSKLADNAQFWIAECQYAEKDYENAILSYETLLKKYPESKKKPSALLKQGFSFIEIGDKKTGKTILKKVAEKFPDSKEAALAKKRLAETDKKFVRKK